MEGDSLNTVCAEQFAEHFSFLQHKRIVLYGIGYRTGAIVNSLRDQFSFLGLMDRDKSNIGKEFFGCQVLDEETVRFQAECIIIVSVSFAEVIYKRIEHLEKDGGIPIYYLDGRRAQTEAQAKKKIPPEYAQLTLEGLKGQVDAHDVASFDLFDTLVMRRVHSPDTVFLLMEQMARVKRLCRDFYKLRKQASGEALARGAFSFDDIYRAFQTLTGLADESIEELKKIEFETERLCIVPRADVVELFEYALKKGKETYIVTDMYYTKPQLEELLKGLGISTGYRDMLVSSEYGADKESGGLWEIFRSMIQDKSCIHFGDNLTSDVINPKKFGIDTIQLYSARELASFTVLDEFLTLDLSPFNQVALGLIEEVLLNSTSFDRNLIDSKGRLQIQSMADLGYTAFGTLVSAFLLWIWQYCSRNKIETVCFCARDGFLLCEDFEFLREHLNTPIKADYLAISRMLALKASIYTESDIEEYLKVPFRGTCEELFKSRFEITIHDKQPIELPDDAQYVKGIVQKHAKEIIESAAETRRGYLKYLSSKMGENTVIVDFGYSGSSQYYLSKILKQPVHGIYMLADMSEGNAYNRGQKKSSYIYDEMDRTGVRQPLYMLLSLLESVYTAPYGTITGCDSKGNFHTAPPMANQRHFEEKAQIDRVGVRRFLGDLLSILQDSAAALDYNDQIGQKLLKKVFSTGNRVDQSLLDGFYTDDVYKIFTERRIFD